MASGEAEEQNEVALQARLAARMYNERATKYEDSWHPTFVYDFLDRLTPPLNPGDKVLDLMRHRPCYVSGGGQGGATWCRARR